MENKKEKNMKKDKKAPKNSECCYMADPCGCYYVVDPCGCMIVDPCC